MNPTIKFTYNVYLSPNSIVQFEKEIAAGSQSIHFIQFFTPLNLPAALKLWILAYNNHVNQKMMVCMHIRRGGGLSRKKNRAKRTKKIVLFCFLFLPTLAITA